MTDRRLDLAVEWVRRTAAAADAGVPDGDLLERFLRGDAAAFELLAWRHQRLVFGVCMRVLRDRDDAEDAFQAAFLVLARKGRTIGRRDSVAAWLYKVAYRCALTARAIRARRASREQPIAHLDMGEPDNASRLTEERELRAILDEELSRLPERFRAPTVLCYLAGKTIEEAAAELGCPRGTVASRLARARERLRVRLVGRGLTLSSGLAALALCDVAAAAPEGLVASTIQFMKLQAAGGAVSAKVAALTERVLKAMFLRKLAIAAAVVAAFTGIFFAGGAFALQLHAQAPAVEQKAVNGIPPEPPVQPPAAQPKAAQAPADPPPAQPEPPVKQLKPPPASMDFVGSLEPSQEIKIGSRVAGPLDKVYVKEGDDVKKGDPLFEIDPRVARLEVEQAAASLAQAEARHKAAAADQDRAKSLLKANGISREEFDQAAVEAAVTSASLKVAQAILDRARLSPESHRILAPVAGRIARVFVDAGNLVAADGAKALATLVVVNPLILQFEMDERTFLRFQKLKQAGQEKAMEIRFAFFAADEKDHPHKAILHTVRPTVDPNLGTVVVRAMVPNPERLILPGMAVFVEVTFPKAQAEKGKP
jgi:RND family efflux transporter MFP subunit